MNYTVIDLSPQTAPQTQAFGVQNRLCFDMLSEDEIHFRLNPTSSKSSWGKIVGQVKAKRRLNRLIHAAWLHPEHLFTTNILFEGPASVGKTTFARTLFSALALPLAELNGAKIKTATEIMEGIKKSLQALDAEFQHQSSRLTLTEVSEGQYYPPPMGIFIDESHRLPKELQELLLKAIERDDRVLETEDGNTLDLRRVCWVFATTDRGKLLATLDSRFKKIKLKLYNREEIAQIIQLNHPDFSWDLCKVVASYVNRVPREAKDFAEEVVVEKSQNPHQSWEQAVVTVAEDAEIDPLGMTYQRLDILTALGQQGPMGIARLCHVAQCEEEELRRYVLPALMTSSPGEPALMAVNHKHFITLDGLKELDRREIPNLGVQALPKGYIH